MTQTKREFLASFSVKVDTKRVKFEVADGEPYGSASGLYRVRMGRVWIDGFYTREGLAKLVTDAALGTLPCTHDAEPEPVHRVSVWFDKDGYPVLEAGFAMSPWIRNFDGQWKILVRTPSFKGFVSQGDVVA